MIPHKKSSWKTSLRATSNCISLKSGPAGGGGGGIPPPKKKRFWLMVPLFGWWCPFYKEVYFRRHLPIDRSHWGPIFHQARREKNFEITWRWVNTHLNIKLSSLVVFWLHVHRGAGAGGGGARGATFCANWMDMPVPPPLNFGNH